MENVQPENNSVSGYLERVTGDEMDFPDLQKKQERKLKLKKNQVSIVSSPVQEMSENTINSDVKMPGIINVGRQLHNA